MPAALIAMRLVARIAVNDYASDWWQARRYEWKSYLYYEKFQFNKVQLSTNVLKCYVQSFIELKKQWPGEMLFHILNDNDCYKRDKVVEYISLERSNLNTYLQWYCTMWILVALLKWKNMTHVSRVNRSSHIWHLKWSSRARWARRASRHFISFELWIELFVLQPLILICSALQKRFQYEHQSWTWGLWSCNHLQDIRFSPCIGQRQMNRRLHPRRRSSAVRNNSCRAQGTYPAAVMDKRQIMGSAIKGVRWKKRLPWFEIRVYFYLCWKNCADPINAPFWHLCKPAGLEPPVKYRLSTPRS